MRDILAHHKHVLVPIQLLPNLSGIDHLQICGFGTCIDAPEDMQDLHFEQQWYATKFAPTHCQTFRGDGFYTGKFGDGSRTFFPGPGTQLFWNVSTLRANASDNAFLFDCP